MARRNLRSLLVAAALCALGPVAVLAQTDLRVTKSGNDVAFNWTLGSQYYIVSASSGDPQFRFPQTLATDLSGPPGSYAYYNGLSNGINLQFFDVSGPGEASPLGKYTGGEVSAGSVSCKTIIEPWNQYDGSLRTDTDPQ
jgi:hypothetical protein